MKKLLLSLFVASIFIFHNSISLSAERGPTIKGFNLGMTYQETESMMKSIKEKDNNFSIISGKNYIKIDKKMALFPMF